MQTKLETSNIGIIVPEGTKQVWIKFRTWDGKEVKLKLPTAVKHVEVGFDAYSAYDIEQVQGRIYRSDSKNADPIAPIDKEFARTMNAARDEMLDKIADAQQAKDSYELLKECQETKPDVTVPQFKSALRQALATVIS
jgi:hypothetical protein